MTITPSLFEAFLKCPTKCWLRFIGEPPTGNSYAEWVQTQTESYRAKAARQLIGNAPADECAPSPGSSRREEGHNPAENLKNAKWPLAVDVLVRTPESNSRSSRGNEAQISSTQRTTFNPQPNDQSLLTSAATIIESRLHAVERVPSDGRGKPAQFVPIRFVFRNKLTPDDRLLLAFDAFVLSEMLGRDVSLGKIIHGDDLDCARSSRGNEAQTFSSQLSTLNPQPISQSLLTSAATHNGVDEPQTAISATLGQAQPRITKVKTSALASEVRKRLEKIAALLSSPAPPDLVLNRHCAECEFQARCRKIAVEKDDLSLLAGMSAKERQKLRRKGIFTVTQLSYTFRPRRRPKRLRDKREKYHHSLKALAIREKKIHIVGSPELKIEGTPVYLDVEGLPDRDFYYLIGLRIGHGESAVQHSLWADTVVDEGKIWREFLTILETVEKPVLIHYGSYEIEFLKQMSKRHEPPLEGSAAMKATVSAVNLVSVLFSQIYFPTYSNGLKELGTWLRCTWPRHTVSGLETIAHRNEWEICGGPELQRFLTDYNTRDCIALEVLTKKIHRLCKKCKPNAKPSVSGAIYTDSMQTDSPYHFGKVKYALPEFESINKASYWDYQRARIRLRTSAKSKIRQGVVRRTVMQKRVFSKTIESCLLSNCPHCNGINIKLLQRPNKVVLDMQFTRTGLRRTSVRYLHHYYKCRDCGGTFKDRPKHWPKHLTESGLVAFVCYQLIEQRLSWRMIKDGLAALFGIERGLGFVEQLKERAAKSYHGAYERLKEILIKGDVIYADETHVSLGGKRSFVWVFSSAKEAVFVHTDTREGTFLGEFLMGFKGVLVSDFYAAYDSIPCPQQKCLVHLMRDINSDLLKRPFDDDLKQLAHEFANLLRPMVDTVDQFGLKTRFLRKHKRAGKSFFKKLTSPVARSEVAEKYCNRFLKERDKLFTFLDHDGVSWNNNNAEHAVKAFVFLRKAIGASSTKKGIAEYLVLLSIYETCKRNDVAFLDFLRSGEKDIHAFAESRRGRRRRTQTSQSSGLPAEAIPGSGGQP